MNQSEDEDGLMDTIDSNNEAEPNSGSSERPSVEDDSGREPGYETPWEIFEGLYERHDAGEDSGGDSGGDSGKDSETSFQRTSDPWIIAFAMFCDLFGITRAAYSVFISIRSLASKSSLDSLPKSFSTLKKWAYSQLPMAKIHSKRILVRIDIAEALI